MAKKSLKNVDKYPIEKKTIEDVIEGETIKDGSIESKLFMRSRWNPDLFDGFISFSVIIFASLY